MTALVGILMAVCFIICYIPQIVRIVKNKSAKDVSPFTYFLMGIGCDLAIAYNAMSGFKPWFFINYLISAILCISILFLYRKWGVSSQSEQMSGQT